ncbi:MAG: hypothetical protein HN580_12420 [Deltaproteobacteria bacterium]|jgi:hypothetical protein|nr:hypothetical protein [Deltaproteobacteria bacterium]MBT4089333.1 hypothetical protein [Deltaproteobacteria bacterium]MBT6501206.1 hypothetical protein [Deltaproteobacteria bacterium]MBT6616054.1 hypothetical protein [Deltaproteobacteria bacterium]MBT7153022.1 hypothetical protein [Deltaproteobacteria bacterium]
MNTIIAFVIAIIFARKRPLIGSIVGCLTISGKFLYFNSFTWTHFFNEVWLGFIMCFVFSFLAFFVLAGTKGGNHNTGPSFMAGAGGGRGGAPPGGIIQSDEEIQRNKRK